MLQRGQSIEKLVDPADVPSKRSPMCFTQGDDGTLGVCARWITEPPVHVQMEILSVLRCEAVAYHSRNHR